MRIRCPACDREYHIKEPGQARHARCKCGVKIELSTAKVDDAPSLAPPPAPSPAPSPIERVRPPAAAAPVTRAPSAPIATADDDDPIDALAALAAETQGDADASVPQEPAIATADANAWTAPDDGGITFEPVDEDQPSSTWEDPPPPSQRAARASQLDLSDDIYVQVGSDDERAVWEALEARQRGATFLMRGIILLFIVLPVLQWLLVQVVESRTAGPMVRIIVGLVLGLGVLGSFIAGLAFDLLGRLRSAGVPSRVAGRLAARISCGLQGLGIILYVAGIFVSALNDLRPGPLVTFWTASSIALLGAATALYLNLLGSARAMRRTGLAVFMTADYALVVIAAILIWVGLAPAFGHTDSAKAFNKVEDFWFAWAGFVFLVATALCIVVLFLLRRAIDAFLMDARHRAQNTADTDRKRRGRGT